MSSEPLPDHYKALGIDKNADAATIKKTYRKLVLTCHPDKVTDEALKAQKQDEFHKIQQAYETLSDETRRATYEAELKLAQLRREKLARTASGSTVEPKSARFTQPTAGGGSYTANTSSRYATEERRPSGATPSRRHEHDDDRYYNGRKTESYFPSPRRQSPRPSPSSRSSREKHEKESRSERPSADRTRSSAAKARDSERRDRTAKFPVDSDGSSGEDRARYDERGYKTRSAEDEPRRRAEEHRQDDRRYDGYENSTPARKLSVQESDAIRYMHKARAEVEPSLRPSPTRTTSRDYYESSSRSSRHREVRPEPAPRRSSVRPKERLGMSSRRDTDRGIPEVVDWDERRPTFKQSSSSPAEIRIPTTPQRSATDSYRRSERSPPRFPGISRSATMPTVPGSEAGGSRREAKSYPRPSGLRNEANGSPERDAYPTVPPPQSSSKTYYYSLADGGVKPVDPPPHRTILREPERVRHRSPSPISRPPMGANRPSLHSSKTYAPGRSSRQSSPVREERGRSNQMKYGEMPSEYTRRREMGERQPSYSPQNVSYAPSYGPEDVHWAPRRGEERYTERKPTLSRTATSVY
ncbi:DnaJ-domain-containing protein [Macroventuria anomochaeta]|uniref:DnaJ-domain-containing protein n=1 Tax=Macroventuria anomochaeta TaxID=301207 RepID=A0ACB6S2D4_9PLEO|nr:DnaJ-domain-containing protein [Macroventuria anomochaeta]KAF2628127.1 DnaJ-domain-containing protein [Macroventuria anomochaeta]